MLNRLDISNYALIENVSLNFKKGFTTITGETGAGKSILLKALELLLGERADTSVLKQSEKKCVLEAVFDVSKLSLKSFFEEYELDYEDQCILRREFTPSGKSRGFINDTPVQMAQLKELGQRLISIHSQHQTLELFSSEFQTEVIDAFSGIEAEVLDYRNLFQLYRRKVNEHIELKVKDMENRKERDYLSFLINELKAADLDNTNLDELKSKSDQVDNAEKISEQLGLSKSVFDNETYGPQIGINTILEAFEELKQFDSKYANIHARLLSLKIELDDLKNEIENHDAEFDLSDAEAVQIKEKMDLLNSLTFKHNLNEITALKDLLYKLQEKLNEIDSLEDHMHLLETEITELKSNLQEKAESISRSRKNSAVNLCEQIHTSLGHLAMENSELQLSFQRLEHLGPFGIDAIEFLFKANLGGTFLPIKKVASGGELSRLMLSIFTILSAHKNLPTLIFDEIDTGVSGEVASRIAAKFESLGEKIQLVSITHLAQVAAKGQQHLHVSKISDALKTVTSVVELKGENRITELAKMISGEEITEAARENALHLLNPN
jgi:DNA repair protein RecN (Recombination protein N)